MDFSVLENLNVVSREDMRVAIRKAKRNLDTFNSTQSISSSLPADELAKIRYIRCARFIVAQVEFERMAYKEAERARGPFLARKAVAALRKAEAGLSPSAGGRHSRTLSGNEVVHPWVAGSQGYATIKDLPAELLQIIFKYITRVQQETRMLEAGSSVMLLTHVCRYWREAAIACPALWNTISIQSNRRKGCLALLQQALERARIVDLDVTIDWDHSFNGDPELGSLLPVIMSSKSQWANLTMALRGYGHNATRMKLVDSLQGSELGKLRSIAVRTSDTQCLALRALCTAASNLLSLKLETSRIAMRFPFTLPSLRSLQLANCRNDSVTNLASFLEAFPELSSLTITSYALSDGGYSRITKMVPLHGLSYLRIGICDDQVCKSTLSIVDCPLLRHLEIDASGSGKEEFDETIEFLVSNTWPLETLDIAALPCRPGRLGVLLKSLKHIRRLRLGDGRGACEPFPLLAALSASSHSCVLPTLKKLIVHGVCDPTVVLKWIESRHWDATTRIQSFAAKLLPKVGNEEVIQWLGKLVVLEQIVMYEPTSFECQ